MQGIKLPGDGEERTGMRLFSQTSLGRSYRGTHSRAKTGLSPPVASHCFWEGNKSGLLSDFWSLDIKAMKRNHLKFFLMGLQNAPVRFTLNYLNAFLENKNYFLLRMIQYLHSMECRIETGGVNPTDGEIVSQIMGAGGWQGQEQRVGFVPAQNCSALSRIQVGKKGKKGCRDTD